VPGAAVTSRTWALVVPACEWLTANTRLRPIQVAGEVRLWRQAVFVACQAAKLPTGITPVRIVAVAHYAGRPPVRDRLNLAPTIKAVVDGLGPARTLFRNGKPAIRTVGYGFLPDDSDEHVLDTTWKLEQTLGQPRLELFLTHEPAVTE